LNTRADYFLTGYTRGKTVKRLVGTDSFETVNRTELGIESKQKEVPSHPDPPTVPLKVKQVPLPHYTLGLLMMSYKLVRNM
jgi:hypothetical protein